tara:strand:- start:70 stop:495 length:426 start_codon:yes stop_codon:yes gene_type:complete
MATTKTLLSNLSSLLCNGIISEAEHTRIQKRIQKAEAQAAEAAVIADLVPELQAYMVAGIQYKISDLVRHVMGILAPCHGYKETKEEQKFRDGVAKPRMIAALQLLGATKTGAGAQTRYSFGEVAPEFETNAADEEESAES